MENKTNFTRLKPAFNDCNNCIIFSANDAFVPCLSVMIQSIIEHQNQDNRYDIIVLHKDISQLYEYYLKGMVRNVSNIKIRLCDVSPIIGDHSFFTKNRKNFTEEAYFRLIIPWVLDDRYQYAVYLDGDMVVQKDVYMIFAESPADCLISAIRDYWGICNCYIPGDPRRAYRESIGLKDIDSYVISSTIIFNLRLFRRRFVLDNILMLASEREWEQHDQDVLNLLCKNSIKYLSPTWGMMTDWGNNYLLPLQLQNELAEVNSAPSVIHFGGSRKPWMSVNNGYNYEYVMAFWKYAECTPFFNILIDKIKSNEHKNYIIYQLSNGKPKYQLTTNGVTVSYKGAVGGRIDQGHSIYRQVQVSNTLLHLEGMAAFWGIGPGAYVRIVFSVNGKLVPATKQTTENGCDLKRNISFMYRGESFELDLPLSPDARKIVIYLVGAVDNLPIKKTNLGFGKFCCIGKEFSNAFYYKNGWIIRTNRKCLIVTKCNWIEYLKREIIFCRELLGTHKRAYFKAVAVRILIALLRNFKGKPIWLISDRVSRADDNGEAFFRYLSENGKHEITPIFVISKDSPDYARLKKYGKVVNINSYAYKILLLLADCAISGQTDEIFRNPFHNYYHAYRDYLGKIRFIFLQHGIIVTDCSAWLNKRNQQMSLFIISAIGEHSLIKESNYGYGEKELALTGLPRFDYLEDHAEKIITVMPTWRKYLATYPDPRTGIWELKSNFAKSKYATFYRNLMSNPKLNDYAKKYGYTLQFRIHPTWANREYAFRFDRDIKIADSSVSYREIYSRSSLILTDYSSSIFDFLYLGKPIIYAQFDKQEFFSGKQNYDRSSYDYERDGFGEVEYDLESTVDRIIEYMENGCKLKDKYRERIDRFFAFHDKNNCQRVYEKIMELEKKEGLSK